MSLTESPWPHLGQFLSLRHSNVPSRPRKGWAQSATLFCCSVGILACACYAAFALVPPRWNAPGFPSYYGYGKNVEQAALGLTLLGVTLFVIAGGRRASWLFTFGLLAVALGLIKVYYGGSRWATTILLPLFAMIGAYFVWYDGPRDEECVTEPNEIPRWHLWITGFLVPFFAMWLFLTAFQPAPTMDLHHDGEVISSAVDLVSGGVPFRSYFWPHGVSDSGVGALILTLTGNQGMGMILLLNGFNLVLGFLSLFLMALGLTRQPLSAVLIAALVSFVVTAQRVVDGRGLLPILAFLLLSVRTDRLAVFGAGALVGLSYVWRIDTGVFCPGHSHALPDDRSILHPRLRPGGWTLAAPT